MKFTSKTDKATGPYSSFYPDSHHIKLNKKQVGSIDDKFPYKIRLYVIKKDIMDDGNPNCDWRHITLIRQSESLQSAKDWLNTNINRILKKYNLKSL